MTLSRLACVLVLAVALAVPVYRVRAASGSDDDAELEWIISDMVWQTCKPAAKELSAPLVLCEKVAEAFEAKTEEMIQTFAQFERVTKLVSTLNTGLYKKYLQHIIDHVTKKVLSDRIYQEKWVGSEVNQHFLGWFLNLVTENENWSNLAQGLGIQQELPEGFDMEAVMAQIRADQAKQAAEAAAAGHGDGEGDDAADAADASEDNGDGDTADGQGTGDDGAHDEL